MWRVSDKWVHLVRMADDLSCQDTSGQQDNHRNIVRVSAPNIEFWARKHRAWTHGFEGRPAADEVEDDVVRLQLHPLAPALHGHLGEGWIWEYSAKKKTVFAFNWYLLQLVSPTSNVIHENLIRSQLELHRCPGDRKVSALFQTENRDRKYLFIKESHRI